MRYRVKTGIGIAFHAEPQPLGLLLGLPLGLSLGLPLGRLLGLPPGLPPGLPLGLLCKGTWPLGLPLLRPLPPRLLPCQGRQHHLRSST